MFNVLVIVVDCLRADFVYERGRAHTPTMDRLRDSGFSFSNAITSSTTTTPSFASLLTGLYPFEHGVRSLSGYRLAKETVTFPEVMRAVGFNTYAEVTGPMVPEAGFADRFSEYRYREPCRTVHTDWGDRFIEKLKHYYETPWLVLLHIWSLHQPRVLCSTCDSERYGKSRYARAVSSVDHYLGRLSESTSVNTLTVVTADHGEQIALSPVDALIKKLGRRAYKKLRYHGLTEMHFAKAMRRFHVGHGYGVYDSLVRVPLILHGRGLVPAGHSSCQVRHLDLFPTVLDLLKLGQRDVTGASAVSIMTGERAVNRDVYLEAAGNVIPTKEEWLEGIRIGNRYKYIYSPFRADFTDELYFLQDDPKERRNLAGRFPSIVAQMRGRIKNMKTDRVPGARINEHDQELLLNRLQDLGYVE